MRQLEFAVAVADHLHFGRAAESLHVSQPGLSSQIHELEKRLAIQLFERSTRRVVVTSPGADIIERARLILAQRDQLLMVAALHHGSIRGHLCLASIPTMAPYLLPDMVRVCGQLWPEVELQLQELKTSNMVSAIEQGEVDLGLLATPFETGKLHVVPLAEDPFCLAVPSAHHLAKQKLVPLSILAELPILMLEEGHCLRDQAMDACAVAGQADINEVHSASLSTLTQMVASGVGVTLLPASALAVEARPGTGVNTVPFLDPAPGRTIALAWRHSDPRHELFVEASEAFSQQFTRSAQDWSGPSSIET